PAVSTLFFSSSAHLLVLHSFPTRRSSDLVDVAARRCAEQAVPGAFLQDDLAALPFPSGSINVIFAEGVLHHTDSTRDALHRLARSEEHTSELQSQSNLVCRLLLEKKKNTQ